MLFPGLLGHSFSMSCFNGSHGSNGLYSPMQETPSEVAGMTPNLACDKKGGARCRDVWVWENSLVHAATHRFRSVFLRQCLFYWCCQTQMGSLWDDRVSVRSKGFDPKLSDLFDLTVWHVLFVFTLLILCNETPRNSVCPLALEKNVWQQIEEAGIGKFAVHDSGCYRIRHHVGWTSLWNLYVGQI